MASKMFYKLQSPDRNVVMLALSFAPNTDTTPAAASNKGVGFSVAYTTTGTWTITLSERYYHLLSAQATLQLASAADQELQIGAVDLAAKTIVVRCVSGGSASQVAANANNRVNVILYLRNMQG